MITVGRKTEITNLLAHLPRLGVGLAYRESFRDELLHHQSEVDFVEIIGDHYIDAPPERMDELALLSEHFTILPHFTNLSLGTAEGIDPVYLEKIANLIRRLNPPWWSEHIGFTRAGGIHLGQSAPLPFTQEAVEVMTKNIITARRAIATPLMLENVCSPLAWPGGEMDEPTFISEVLRSGGTGLLLDVSSLLNHAVNLGGTPATFLEKLPLDRVVQVHFSGGQDACGQLVESRAHPIPEALWQLLDDAVARAPVRCICLERDDVLPPLSEMLGEVERARAIGRQHQRWS